MIEVIEETYQRFDNGEEQVTLRLSDGTAIRLWTDQWGVPHRQWAMPVETWRREVPLVLETGLDAALVKRIEDWTGMNWRTP